MGIRYCTERQSPLGGLLFPVAEQTCRRSFALDIIQKDQLERGWVFIQPDILLSFLLSTSAPRGKGQASLENRSGVFAEQLVAQRGGQFWHVRDGEVLANHMVDLDGVIAGRGSEYKRSYPRGRISPLSSRLAEVGKGPGD